MQNSDFTFDEALKNRLNFGDDNSLRYSYMIPQLSNQTDSTEKDDSDGSKKNKKQGYLESIGIGTPEMMAAGAGLQILGQHLDAPYREMAAKQAMEMHRRDKQDAALKNLQGISQLYGRL